MIVTDDLPPVDYAEPRVDESLLLDVQSVVSRSAHLRQKLDETLDEMHLSRSGLSRAEHVLADESMLRSAPTTPVRQRPSANSTLAASPAAPQSLEDLASGPERGVGLAGLWDSKFAQLPSQRRTVTEADEVAKIFTPFVRRHGVLLLLL